MKIVIDIDDDMYKAVINNDAYVLGDVDWILLENAIANSIPLPKGHGRLIDADKVLDDMSRAWVTGGARSVMQGYVAKSPTVIEADKAESEE